MDELVTTYTRSTVEIRGSSPSVIQDIIKALGYTPVFVETVGNSLHVMFETADTASMVAKELKRDGRVPYVCLASSSDLLPCRRPSIEAIDCANGPKCKREGCPFRHLATAYTVCRHWKNLRGGCWLGSKCNFLHPLSAIWPEKTMPRPVDQTDTASIGSDYPSDDETSTRSASPLVVSLLPMCLRCNMAPGAVANFPCGHIVMCTRCSANTLTSHCAFCKRKISGTVVV